MVVHLLSFLVLLNPFALFLYLSPVLDDLTYRDFFKVLFRASLISVVIFLIFAELGLVVFNKLLSINFESFRIFGGIVIFSMALIFIIQGRKSFITLRGSLDDLASDIALPFMVGAGTISLSIIIGNVLPAWQTVLLLILAMVINYAAIVLLVLIKYKIPAKRFKIAFDQLMVYALRVNGFFVGAIGVNMTLDGIRNLFQV